MADSIQVLAVEFSESDGVGRKVAVFGWAEREERAGAHVSGSGKGFEKSRPRAHILGATPKAKHPKRDW